MRERDAMLARVAQPVCVVDGCGRFYYVNPSAVGALGYADAGELLGRPAHETVHYKHPDGTPYPAAECPLTRAGRRADDPPPEDWLVRKDGSMLPVSSTSARFDTAAGAGAVVASPISRSGAGWSARRASARRRPGARGRAARGPAAHHRGRGRGARAARARPARRRPAAVRQRRPRPRAGRAGGGLRAAARPRAARARDRPREDGHRRPARPRGGDPSRDPQRPATGSSRAGADLAAAAAGGDRASPGRAPRAPVEASVFFFVSEALTNVVKHAEARAASVDVHARGDTLVVVVADDGRGGARPQGGSGLAGLGDRIEALDGALTVTSPPGAARRCRPRSRSARTRPDPRGGFRARSAGEPRRARHRRRCDPRSTISARAGPERRSRCTHAERLTRRPPSR